MEKIILKKGEGKTKELINRADNYNGYIVVMNLKEVGRVFKMAKDMEKEINQPITFDEFLESRYFGQGVKKFYIDQADVFLQSLCNVPIEAITMSA